jgi:Fur family peroxide stress response transcriptional regulator
MQQQEIEKICAKFRDKCHANGLRVTPQREAIYMELRQSVKHPTAEQVYARIKQRFRNISFDTVNRTLLTFAEIGLAEIVEGYGSPRRYDPDLSPHHHAHCIKCGRILDFENSDYDALEVPPEVSRAFEVISKKIVINAVCNDCRSKRK